MKTKTTKTAKTTKTESPKSQYANGVLLEPGDHVRLGHAGCATYCVVSIRDDKARAVSINDPLNEQIIPRDCIAQRRVARMGNNGAQDYLNRHVAAVEANKKKAATKPKDEEMTETKQKLESHPVKPIKNPRGGLAVAPTPEPPLMSVKPGGLVPMGDALRKAADVKVEKMLADKAGVKGKPAESAESAFPENEFDRAAWEEVIKGGTKDEIAARMVKRFESEKDTLKRKYRTNPANYLRYHDDYVKEVTAAGLVKTPKPAKPSKAKTSAKLVNGTLQ